MRFDGRVDALEQFVICQFHEDWVNEFDDAWQSAEGLIQRCSLGNLAAVAQQIAVFNELFLTSFERYTTFDLGWAFATPEEFDRWLGAVHRRIAQVLAGDEGEPLVAPA